MVDRRIARTPEGTRAGDWREVALCRGAKVDFFPAQKKGRPRSENESMSIRAVRICMECPVRLECLEYALETNQKHGIWGGLVPRERRRIRLMRRRSRNRS